MRNFATVVLSLSLFASCTSDVNEFAEKPKPVQKDTVMPVEKNTFVYAAEKFADLEVLRYNVPDFEKLHVKTKILVYYLYEAALAGRDIIYDQNYKYNLAVRKTLEAIVANHHTGASEA